MARAGRRGYGAGPMDEILIIKLGAFGDVLQAEGALADIRAHHAGARITVLTRGAFRRILERCPSVDRVWVDEDAPRWRVDRMAALARRLRSGGFWRVYDLQDSARSRFYVRWLMPRGIEWSGTPAAASHRHRHPAPKSLPSLERLAGQLADAGVPVRRTPVPDVSWMAADVSGLLAGLGGAPFVLLLPGSSARHPHKRWPGYAELARRLEAEGHRVVSVPGPEELGLAPSLPGTVLVRPDGKALDFFELAGVARAAALVIGNDSGPTHLAAHLGARGLALFGRSHLPARMTGVERPGFRALEVERLADLPVDDVLEAALAGLARTEPARAT
jgi:ADP-heptose:LPS heptosyltransferase